MPFRSLYKILKLNLHLHIMKKTPLLLILFSFLFLVAWRPDVPILLGLEEVIHVYHYGSSDQNFSVSECPEKGVGWEYIDQSWTEYSQGKPSVQLQRQFKKNYLRFWKWREYATHPRWRLEYSAPE